MWEYLENPLAHRTVTNDLLKYREESMINLANHKSEVIADQTSHI